MSLPMAGITAVPLSRIPFIMSMNDGAGGATAGVTQTMAAISGGPGGRQTGGGVLRGVRLSPPVLGGGRRRRVFIDAVDGAHGNTLAAARAQLRDDDHVDAVVEDGAELRRAVTDARVAVDALRHLDPQDRELPL